MNLAGSQLLSSMLAMAATFLALSMLVQVIQEIYKYFSKSKSRLYSKVLIDSIGSWATQLFRPEVAQQYLVRGPLQLWRSRPGGVLMPLNDEALKGALERTAPPRVRQVLRALNHEVSLQKTGPSTPSPSWVALLENLGLVEKGTPGYWSTLDIIRFLKRWHHEWNEDAHSNAEVRSIGAITVPGMDWQFDAAKMLTAFRQDFLNHVDEAVAQYPQIKSNFEYSYARRNMRQSFLFGFVIALFFNFPAHRIYHEASKLSADEAVELAQRTIDIYDKLSQVDRQNDTTEVALKSRLKLLNELQEAGTGQLADYMPEWPDIKRAYDMDWDDQAAYIFGCLLTALMVSFGAPFWNDIASALLRYQKSRNSGNGSASKEEGR